MVLTCDPLHQLSLIRLTTGTNMLMTVQARRRRRRFIEDIISHSFNDLSSQIGPWLPSQRIVLVMYYRAKVMPDSLSLDQLVVYGCIY